MGRDSGASRHRVDDGRHVSRGKGAARQPLAAHVDALLRRHKGLLAWGPEAAQHSSAARSDHQHGKGAALGGHCVSMLRTSTACAAGSLSWLQLRRKSEDMR